MVDQVLMLWRQGLFAVVMGLLGSSSSSSITATGQQGALKQQAATAVARRTPDAAYPLRRVNGSKWVYQRSCWQNVVSGVAAGASLGIWVQQSQSQLDCCQLFIPPAGSTPQHHTACYS